MKKLYYSITAFLLLFLATGCSGFLNETPTASVSVSNFYKTASDAQKALNAVYHQMAQIGVYTGYTKVAFGDIMSDNAIKGGSGPGDQAQLLRLANFNISPTNSAVLDAWTFNYKGVYLSNVVLSKVPGIEMNPKEKASILAQARFLRAYFYLQLVRLFGHIPLVKKPLKAGNYNQPQVGPDKIWAFIIKETNKAAKNLPVKGGVSKSQLGRVTKGAAMALKLYALMWQEKWQEVEKLGDKIIHDKFGQYSLAPNYNKIWTKEGEFGPGSIFEINYQDIPGRPEVGNVIPGQVASRATWGLEFACPSHDLVKAFEKGDPRLEATVVFPSEKLPEGVTAPSKFHSPANLINQKYWLPPSQRPPNVGGGNGLTNERVFRLAEVMLWTAEAAYHNGNIVHATELVNKVRARARHSGGNTDMSILPPYTAVTLQNIYHEERVETALGSHRRFYNLVRTGRAADKLSGFKKGVHNYMPIPANQIRLSNGVLKQNPGY